MRNDRWFIDTVGRDDAQIRLFCFPYAGGGASVYREWQKYLPNEIEVCRPQLPGRENRFKEQPRRNLAVLVEECYQAIEHLLDVDFSFYGHSMGTRIVFELARTIKKRLNKDPIHVFVAACNAPQIDNCNIKKHKLPNDDFLNEIKKLGGTPEEVLESEELMDMMLEVLRSDYALKENYIYYDAPNLNCWLTALAGSFDSETSREGMEAWQEHASQFSLIYLNGGHFFLRSHQSELLNIILNALEPHIKHASTCLKIRTA